MIDPPVITERAAMHAAVIALVIPRGDMGKHFGPAVAEIMAELARQGIAPAGSVFAHHRRVPPGQFDFEVGVPVAFPVAASGRVGPREHPAISVARTVYHGDYPGLHAAWGAFSDWIAANGHATASDLYETYLSNPALITNPAYDATRLERPLAQTVVGNFPISNSRRLQLVKGNAHRSRHRPHRRPAADRRGRPSARHSGCSGRALRPVQGEDQPRVA